MGPSWELALGRMKNLNATGGVALLMLYIVVLVVRSTSASTSTTYAALVSHGLYSR